MNDPKKYGTPQHPLRILDADLSSVPEVYPAIVLMGDACERGATYGQHFRDKIQKNVDRRLAGIKNLQYIWDLCEGVYLPYLKKFAPDWWREMQGIAMAARVHLIHILILNIRDDIAALHDPPAQDKGGSMSAYFSNQISWSHSSLLAHSWSDAKMVVDEDLLVCLEIHFPAADKIPSLLMVTEAGMISGCGINSKGLAVAGNSIFSNQDYPPMQGLELFPVTLLERYILEMNDAVGVPEICSQLQRHASRHLLIADPENLSKSLELTPESCFLHFGPRSGHFKAHANNLQSFHAFSNRREVGDRMKHGGSHKRQARFERYLQENLEERLTQQQIRDMFSDHGDSPLGICQHNGDPDDDDDNIGDANDTTTVAFVLFNTAKKIMAVCKGPPCRRGRMIHLTFSTIPLEVEMEDDFDSEASSVLGGDDGFGLEIKDARGPAKGVVPDCREIGPRESAPSPEAVIPSIERVSPPLLAEMPGGPRRAMASSFEDAFPTIERVSPSLAEMSMTAGLAPELAGLIGRPDLAWATGREDTKPTGREDTKPTGREDTKSTGREDTKSTGREDTKPAIERVSPPPAEELPKPSTRMLGSAPRTMPDADMGESDLKMQMTMLKSHPTSTLRADQDTMVARMTADQNTMMARMSEAMAAMDKLRRAEKQLREEEQAHTPHQQKLHQLLQEQIQQFGKSRLNNSSPVLSPIREESPEFPELERCPRRSSPPAPAPQSPNSEWSEEDIYDATPIRGRSLELKPEALVQWELKAQGLAHLESKGEAEAQPETSEVHEAVPIRVESPETRVKAPALPRKKGRGSHDNNGLEHGKGDDTYGGSETSDAIDVEVDTDKETVYGGNNRKLSNDSGVEIANGHDIQSLSEMRGASEIIEVGVEEEMADHDAAHDKKPSNDTKVMDTARDHKDHEVSETPGASGILMADVGETADTCHGDNPTADTYGINTAKYRCHPELSKIPSVSDIAEINVDEGDSSGRGEKRKASGPLTDSPHKQAKIV